MHWIVYNWWLPCGILWGCYFVQQCIYTSDISCLNVWVNNNVGSVRSRCMQQLNGLNVDLDVLRSIKMFHLSSFIFTHAVSIYKVSVLDFPIECEYCAEDFFVLIFVLKKKFKFFAAWHSNTCTWYQSSNMISGVELKPHLIGYICGMLHQNQSLVAPAHF